MSWSVPSADGAAIDGYSIVFSTATDTNPETSKTPTADYSQYVTATSTTSAALPDGNTWYFHIRAQDVNGLWSDASHFGPFIIDITPAPTVTKIEPDNGLNSSDTISVAITGTNFKKLDGSVFTSVTAKIGTTALNPVTVNSSTSITATYAIKDKTAGAKDVTVTTGWGTSEALSGGFTVKNPAPTVTAISPTSASNAADKTVTITGTGFLSGASVQLRDPEGANSNIDLTGVTVSSKTSITAIVPAGKTVDTYNVVVTNTDLQSWTFLATAGGFQIKLPAPTITTVSPSSGTNEKTTTITITGTNYQTSGTTLVTLEATGKTPISCTSVSVSSATTITAVVPADKVTGAYDVKVTNPDGQSAPKSAAFTVTYPVPTVATISPASMTNDGTQSVTITGTNFRSGVTVKIGTTSCTGVTRDGTTPSTKLTCIVPASITPDTYDVKVTNTGTDPGTLTDGFTVSSGTTTAGLTYSASDTGSVPAGDLTITATFTQSQSAAPKISIAQQGTTDISEVSMTPSENDKIWTYPYTVHAADDSSYVDGEATVTIKSSAGTAISVTSGSTFTIDTASLSAQITYEQGDNTSSPFKAGDLTITVTLSSLVTNAPKISINQQGSTDISNDSNLSGSGASRTYVYTIVAKTGDTYKDGAATVTLKDSDNSDASIPIGSGGTFTIDTTPPTVAMTYTQGSNTAGPFKAGSLTITATFSETPESTPQIALVQQGGTNITATNMTAADSGRVWTYPYTVHAATEAGYADGEATVTITNGGDSASNPNAVATNNTFTIDTTSPTAALTYTQGDNTSGPFKAGSLTITATFNEAMKDSPKSKIAISGTDTVTATDMTKTDSTHYYYSHTVGSGNGTATVSLSTGTDVAGNEIVSTPTSGSTFTVDNTAPQVSSASYVDTTHVDVAFNEAVSGGTTAGNYSISGLTISAAADQGSNTYRLTTSEMTAGQTYTVVVSNVTDLAGNALGADYKSAEYTTVTLGDVDNNGQINVFDVIKIARASLGLENTGTYIEAAADITGDGNINVFDVIKASRLSLGLD